MRIIQSWLLSLYPREWRERYGEEFVALLGLYTPSWCDLLDIFFCALYERIIILLQKGNDMLNQQKMETSIFRACLVFGSLITLGILITGMILVRTEFPHNSTALTSGLMSCFF